jgi:hypothetical protein
MNRKEIRYGRSRGLKLGKKEYLADLIEKDHKGRTIRVVYRGLREDVIWAMKAQLEKRNIYKLTKLQVVPKNKVT